MDNWLELLLGRDEQVHRYKSHEQTEGIAVLDIYPTMIKRICLSVF
ncbi:MAG: hypothetical protein ACUVUE_08325 [Candidatus Bathycorpusculaceae bacterium]